MKVPTSFLAAVIAFGFLYVAANAQAGSVMTFDDIYKKHTVLGTDENALKTAFGKALQPFTGHYAGNNYITHYCISPLSIGQNQYEALFPILSAENRFGNKNVSSGTVAGFYIRPLNSKLAKQSQFDSVDGILREKFGKPRERVEKLSQGLFETQIREWVNQGIRLELVDGCDLSITVYPRQTQFESLRDDRMAVREGELPVGKDLHISLARQELQKNNLPEAAMHLRTALAQISSEYTIEDRGGAGNLEPIEQNRLSVLKLLALVEQKRNHLDAVITCYQQIVELEERLNGKKNPSTVSSADYLAKLYESRGDQKEAERLRQHMSKP